MEFKKIVFAGLVAGMACSGAWAMESNKLKKSLDELQKKQDEDNKNNEEKRETRGDRGEETRS